MKGSLLLASLVLIAGGLFISSGAGADEPLVRFKGGIGVIPVSNVTVTAGVATVNANVVRGVNPAGQIWRIEDLDATVRTNGDISVEGKGLVLAGGNNVGRTSGQSVFATLICEAAAPFVQHSTESTTGVALALNGDFKIDDVLSGFPLTDCASPMLLIRSTGTGNAWFAAGILDTDQGNNGEDKGKNKSKSKNK
jgi:hypothetical protein